MMRTNQQQQQQQVTTVGAPSTTLKQSLVDYVNYKKSKQSKQHQHTETERDQKFHQDQDNSVDVTKDDSELDFSKLNSYDNDNQGQSFMQTQLSPTSKLIVENCKQACYQDPSVLQLVQSLPDPSTFSSSCCCPSRISWLTKFSVDRISCLSFLIEVAVVANISDEALFKSVELAESALANLHLKFNSKNNFRLSDATQEEQRQNFLLLQPHYTYAICLLLASKQCDLQYLNLTSFLHIIQTRNYQNYSQQKIRIQIGLIEREFAELELQLIKLVDDLYPVTTHMLLSRLTAGYNKLVQDMANYLLHICMFSTTLQKEARKDVLAASCLNLARRILTNRSGNDQTINFWPSFTRDVAGGLTEEDLFQVTKQIAYKYVDIVNQRDASVQKHQIVIEKFAMTKNSQVSQFKPMSAQEKRNKLQN